MFWLATFQILTVPTLYLIQITGLAVSSKHTYMFSAGDDKQVKCWDLDQNKVVNLSPHQI